MRYEVYVPPVRSWPRLAWANYKMLCRLTLGRTWTQMNAFRRE